MDRSFYIEQYAKLSKIHKDLCRVLYQHEIKRRRGLYKDVRLKKSTISGYSSCSTRTVQRFNKVVKYFLIGVEERKKENGNQAANRYHFDVDFFEAMRFLDINNLLYKSREKILDSVNPHRQIKNVSLTPKICLPSYSSSSYTENMYMNSYVHPSLNKIEIDLQTKIRLSKFPEHAIIKGLEDAAWWWKKGNRPRTTLEAVVTARIKSYDRI